MSYKVSPKSPPPFDSVLYWERSESPYHPKAMRRVLRTIDRFLLYGFSACLSKSPAGWLGIDGIENPICFIPDGEIINKDEPPHIPVMGRYGKWCAFPLPADLEVIARHIQPDTRRAEQ